jgi:hypothetical protein
MTTRDPNSRAYWQSLGVPEHEIDALLAGQQQYDAARSQQAHQNSLDLAEAGIEAVLSGQGTWGEVAGALLASGETVAHDLFVGAWQQSDLIDAEDFGPAGFGNPLDGAETAADYTFLRQQQDEVERAQAADAVEQARQDLAKGQVSLATQALHQYLAQTAVSEATAQKLTENARQRLANEPELLEKPDQLGHVFDQETARIQRVDAQLHALEESAAAAFRAQRKGARGADMVVDGVAYSMDTQTGAKRAEEAFKAKWVREHAEDIAVDPSWEAGLTSLPETAAEQEAAQIDRIRARNESSQGMHNEVGDIEKRGRAAAAGEFGLQGERDRSRSEAESYREALKRAELKTEIDEGGNRIRSAYLTGDGVERVDNRPPLPAVHVRE